MISPRIQALIAPFSKNLGEYDQNSPKLGKGRVGICFLHQGAKEGEKRAWMLQQEKGKGEVVMSCDSGERDHPLMSLYASYPS